MSDPVCPTLFPDTVSCSGGSCVADGVCECPRGFSGSGDFVIGSPTCNINLEAIRYEWLIVLAVHLIVLPFSAEFLIRELRKTRYVNSLYASFMLIANIFIAVAAILKMENPEASIGNDATITVPFVIGSWSFWSCNTMTVYVFLELNARQARIRQSQVKERLDRVFASLRKILPVTWVGTSFSMLCPLFMLASTSPETHFALGLLHYTFAALSMVVFAYFLVPHAINPLAEEISDVLKSVEDNKLLGAGEVVSANSGETSKLKTLVTRLNNMVQGIKNSTLVNFPPAILMGCWPFLQQNSSYFLPFAWASAGVVIATLLMSNQPSHRTICGRTVFGTTDTGEGTDSEHKVNNNNKRIYEDGSMGSFKSSNNPIAVNTLSDETV